MSRVAVGVCLLLVVGMAAAYPTWSELLGQLPSLAGAPSVSGAGNSTSVTQTGLANTTEPDVFSLETLTTSQSSAASLPFGAEWVSQFFGVVDGYRNGANFTECPRLDSFAMTRFETMTNGTNWEITHYGYAEDQAAAFGGTTGAFAEEYFYPTEPSLRSPAGFANLVETTAPGHWSDLISPAFTYYGTYFQGQGPVLLWQASCGPLELGPNINQTAEFSNCPSQKVTATWLVIELSSVCPQS